MSARVTRMASKKRRERIKKIRKESKQKDITTHTEKAQHHPWAYDVYDDRVNIKMIYLRVFQISIDDNSVVK